MNRFLLHVCMYTHLSAISETPHVSCICVCIKLVSVAPILCSVIGPNGDNMKVFVV